MNAQKYTFPSERTNMKNVRVDLEWILLKTKFRHLANLHALTHTFKIILYTSISYGLEKTLQI